MNKLLIISLTFLSLVGCVTTSEYQISVDNYHELKSQIELGMSYSQVVEILAPAYAHESVGNIRVPDQYIKDGVKVQIYYARSSWVKDGNLTDDELTPYLFNDGELISIGWMNLGGPNTQGQVPDTHSTTVINSAPIIVY